MQQGLCRSGKLVAAGWVRAVGWGPAHCVVLPPARPASLPLPLCQWSAAGSVLSGHSRSSLRSLALSTAAIAAAAAHHTTPQQPGRQRAGKCNGSEPLCAGPPRAGPMHSWWAGAVGWPARAQRTAPTCGADAVPPVPLLHQLWAHLAVGCEGHHQLLGPCTGAVQQGEEVRQAPGGTALQLAQHSQQ